MKLELQVEDKNIESWDLDLPPVKLDEIISEKRNAIIKKVLLEAKIEIYHLIHNKKYEFYTVFQSKLNKMNVTDKQLFDFKMMLAKKRSDKYCGT
jgi:hypothetical protein